VVNQRCEAPVENRQAEGLMVNAEGAPEREPPGEAWW
jgi:hypothetical protein